MPWRRVCILVLCSIIQSALPAGNASQPVRGDAAAAVQQAIPFPQPNPRGLRILLYKEAPAVCARVYGVDGRLIFEVCSGPQSAGWMELRLPPEWEQAGPGRYLFTVQAGGQYDADKAGVMVRVR